MDSRYLPPTSPRLVLDQEFQDMGALGFAVGGWDLDFRQLDAGPLQARATVVVAAKSAALRVRFNRRLHQQGSPPEETLAFGLPDKPLIWCGMRTVPGQVLNFNLTAGFDGVSEAGFSGTVLLLDPRDLDEYAAEQGLSVDVRGPVSTATCWHGEESRISHLRRRLDGMFQTLETPGGGTEANDLLNHDVLTGLMRAIGFGNEATPTKGRTARSRALQAALELLEDPGVLPLTVLDLCRATGVSPPTLYRAFQETFGVSPKRYLQSRSLSGVRNDLLAAPPGSLVIDTANRWGFWHMGQFAADYRRQFGELPSETLARAG